MKKIKEKCVYKHINKTTNQIFYIGRGIIGRANSIESRNKDWHIINKNYGFYSEIIERNLTEEEASILETEWILKLGRTCDNSGILVNKKVRDKGKSGFKQSAETIAKRIKKTTGRKRSDETKNKMSLAKIGKSSWNKGKPWSKEIKNKLSLAKIGKKMSNETKKRMSISRTGNLNPMFGKPGTNLGKKQSAETIAKRIKTFKENKLINGKQR